MVLKVENGSTHQFQGRVRRNSRDVQSSRCGGAIDEGCVHVVSQVLTRANLGEHTSREHRRRNSKCPVVLAAGEWTTIVADYVVGGQLPPLDNNGGR